MPSSDEEYVDGNASTADARAAYIAGGVPRRAPKKTADRAGDLRLVLDWKDQESRVFQEISGKTWKDLAICGDHCPMCRGRLSGLRRKLSGVAVHN